jgi:hypothetical protein
VSQQETLSNLLKAAACTALALLPWWMNVRHAGFYVVAAAILGGALLGARRALILLVVMGVVLGVAFFVADTINPPPGEDQRAMALLYVIGVPLTLSLPALAGAGIRWLRGRDQGPPIGPIMRKAAVVPIGIFLFALALMEVGMAEALILLAAGVVLLALRPRRA